MGIYAYRVSTNTRTPIGHDEIRELRYITKLFPGHKALSPRRIEPTYVTLEFAEFSDVYLWKGGSSVLIDADLGDEDKCPLVGHLRKQGRRWVVKPGHPDPAEYRANDILRSIREEGGYDGGSGANWIKGDAFGIDIRAGDRRLKICRPLTLDKTTRALRVAGLYK